MKKREWNLKFLDLEGKIMGECVVDIDLNFNDIGFKKSIVEKQTVIEGEWVGNFHVIATEVSTYESVLKKLYIEAEEFVSV